MGQPPSEWGPNAPHLIFTLFSENAFSTGDGREEDILKRSAWLGTSFERHHSASRSKPPMLRRRMSRRASPDVA